MRSIFPNAVLKPAGWFALAYLGYWSALVLDQALVDLLISPLLGASLRGWQLSPFLVSIEMGEPKNPGAGETLITVLPLLLQILFLIVLVRVGSKVRRTSVQVWLQFAGLWTILLLSLRVFLLFYTGGGRLGRLLATLAGGPASSLAGRLAVTALTSLLLLALGRICMGQLIAAARSGWLPPRRPWLPLLMLTTPVLLIVAGALDVFHRAHFIGLRELLILLSPAATCLILGLLGLTWKPKRALERMQSGFNSGGALAAICISAALYAGLHESPSLKMWLAETRLERSSFTHYEILYDPQSFSSEFIGKFATAREALLANLARRLNASLDHARLRVILYSSLQAKRSATGNSQPYLVEGQTLRAVLGGSVAEVDPAADAAALLDAGWGPLGSARIGEWVSRWLAGEWRGRTLEQWAGQIEREGGHYTLAQLADHSSDGYLSPLVRNPLGGAWVGTVFDRLGLPAVRKLYGTKLADMNLGSLARLLGAEPSQLEQDWKQWTSAVASRSSADPPRQRPLDGNFFFRGISFSYEGWVGHTGGYSSPEAASELNHFREMGVNAIAVVPYGFTRASGSEALSYTGTAESDEEMSEAVYRAHRLGMKVLLKPQLWVSRGEFTGAIKFDDPAKRAAWMSKYREFILHYARLAELGEFDLLSIGTELEGVTPYEEEWRRIIASVRRVYHGPITYAANWGKEIESIRFWDALDYVSVNNYYPLAEKPSARVEELLPGAERWAERLGAASHRWQKPLLFTEVGYPSVRGGASQPWFEDRTRGLDLQEQAAAYEATFRAFCSRPWFRGMFWWKWPSNGLGGGPQDASYTPRRKPAEEIVRAWFTRLARDSKASASEAP